MAKQSPITASAVTKAPHFLASRIIMDSDNLPRWFKDAHDVETSRFPEVGGTLRWSVGRKKARWHFTSRVLHNQLPREVRAAAMLADEAHEANVRRGK
jgi:hypothetical protein